MPTDGETYSQDKDFIEQQRVPHWIESCAFVLGIAAPIYFVTFGASYLHSWHVKPVYSWDFSAIITTAVLCLSYLIDLYNSAKEDEVSRPATLILLTVGSGFAFTCISLALVALSLEIWLPPTPGWWGGGPAGIASYAYPGFILATFLSLSVLDWWAARLITDAHKTRFFWALCVFADGPAALAFLILVPYYYIGNFVSSVNPEIVGGALAMQMLTADAVYFGVTSNWVFIIKERMMSNCASSLRTARSDETRQVSPLSP